MENFIGQLRRIKKNASQNAPGALQDCIQRAVMGAAVSQALQKVDVKKLKEEGTFDTLKTFVRIVGPLVMKHNSEILDGIVSIFEAIG